LAHKTVRWITFGLHRPGYRVSRAGTGENGRTSTLQIRTSLLAGLLVAASSCCSGIFVVIANA